MPGVVLEISPQVAAVLAGDAGREIQKMAALKLYECRRISVELAADLAGIAAGIAIALTGAGGWTPKLEKNSGDR